MEEMPSGSERRRRYSAEKVISLLEDFLNGKMPCTQFGEAVMAQWQGIAHREAEEDARRPRPRPSELQRLGLEEDSADDPLTPRERQVREVLGRLEEDVRWYQGAMEENEECDETFVEEELRSAAVHWLDQLRQLA